MNTFSLYISITLYYLRTSSVEKSEKFERLSLQENIIAHVWLRRML